MLLYFMLYAIVIVMFICYCFCALTLFACVMFFSSLYYLVILVNLLYVVNSFVLSLISYFSIFTCCLSVFAFLCVFFVSVFFNLYLCIFVFLCLLLMFQLFYLFSIVFYFHILNLHFMFLFFICYFLFCY